MEEFDKALNDFKRLESLIPNDPSIKNCFELLEQRKAERQKKEHRLFKSFVNSKLYEDKEKPNETTSNVIPKQISTEINPTNPKVFFEIRIGEEENLRRIEFELFADKVPKTAENFRQLCKGFLNENNETYSYKGSKFHRVIKDFMMQGGDFEKGNGTGGMSIYGKKFDDENFSLPHSQPFLLSMANAGPNSNGSQFFITFKETSYLNGKHVVFGRVIKGEEHCRAVESNPTTDNDYPIKEVVIVNCGEIIGE